MKVSLMYKRFALFKSESNSSGHYIPIGDIFRCHRSCAIHNRSTKYLSPYRNIQSGAVESLPLTSDFAGSRPVVVTCFFFMQIIFLNLSYLLLVCISEVFF